MAPAEPAQTRPTLYTADRANQALPLVRAIVTDIVRQWRLVSDLEDRLAPLLSPGRRGPDPLHEEELAHQRGVLDAEQERLRDYLRELEALGVELKSVQDGLCDFPSLRDGREVYLCWRLGEPSVQFWHEIHAGFSGRQPLPPD